MFGRLALMLTVLACAAHFVALVARGMAADPNRVPWGNMYEFTITGSFVVVAGYLLLRKRYGLDWMGPIVTAMVVVLLMVAVLWLYSPIEPLTEALNSYWLVIHVMSAIIATGAFTLGGITSALYLVRARAEKRELAADRGYVARLPSLAVLDRVSYRIHAFAFPVWTFAVLISGPIWAHQAWSSYWNWDPKEVCAFITWVVYAAYLHARATAGWRGRNAAILALVGARHAVVQLHRDQLLLDHEPALVRQRRRRGQPARPLTPSAVRTGRPGRSVPARDLGQELVVVVGPVAGGRTRRPDAASAAGSPRGGTGRRSRSRRRRPPAAARTSTRGKTRSAVVEAPHPADSGRPTER